MRDTPPFLSRLGLDIDADARAIRRAYARLVKQVDQEREVAAFQDLRDAYEVALRWAEYQAAQAAGVVEQAAHSAPAPAPPAREESPEQLSAQVFAAFDAASAALGKGRMADDVGLWADELRLRLADGQLLNIEARTMFEARIAHLLACGWKAGHETLFLAACQVFEWKDDRRRVRRLGGAGAGVDQAIDEHLQFDMLTPKLRETQLSIMRHLRSGKAPDAEQLMRDMYSMERLVEEFPALMAITVGGDNVARWRELARGLPAAEYDHALARPTRGRGFGIDESLMPRPEQAASRTWMYWVALVLVVLVVVAGALLSSREQAQRELRRAAPPVTLAPQPGAPPRLNDPFHMKTGLEKPIGRNTIRPAPAPASAPTKLVPLTRSVDQRMVDAIGARVRYSPLYAPDGAQLRVKYAIQIGADGKLASLKKLSPSYDLNYDLAVEAAIRAHDFAAQKGRGFTLGYGATVRRPAPDTDASSPAARE